MLPPGLSSRLPTKEALRIVRNVIERQDKPIRARDIYKQVQKEPVQTADGTAHAVRSMRYMKQVLLPTLASQQVVKQIHVKPTIKADEKAEKAAHMSKSQRHSTSGKIALHGFFAWQPMKPHPKPKPKPVQEPFGAAVGVGEDWTHLNRRRRRQREESVQRDVEWLKQVEAARQQAASA